MTLKHETILVPDSLVGFPFVFRASGLEVDW